MRHTRKKKRSQGEAEGEEEGEMVDKQLEKRICFLICVGSVFFSSQKQRKLIFLFCGG